jgi:hypothetical protein
VLHGADRRIWTQPLTELRVRPTQPKAAPAIWAALRALAALPFAVVSAMFLAPAGLFYWLALKIRGKR